MSCSRCAELVLSVEARDAQIERLQQELRDATKAGTPYWKERDAMNGLILCNTELSERVRELELVEALVPLMLRLKTKKNVENMEALFRALTTFETGQSEVELCPRHAGPNDNVVLLGDCPDCKATRQDSSPVPLPGEGSMVFAQRQAKLIAETTAQDNSYDPLDGHVHDRRDLGPGRRAVCVRCGDGMSTQDCPHCRAANGGRCWQHRQETTQKPKGITDAVEILKRRYKPTEQDLEEARREVAADESSNAPKETP